MSGPHFYYFIFELVLGNMAYGLKSACGINLWLSVPQGTLKPRLNPSAVCQQTILFTLVI